MKKTKVNYQTIALDPFIFRKSDFLGTLKGFLRMVSLLSKSFSALTPHNCYHC